MAKIRLFPGFLLLTGVLAAQSDKAPVAMIGAEPVYEAEIAAKVEGELRKLRSQEYQIKAKAIEELANERLLAREAEKRGISPEQLIEQEVTSKIQEPSKEEVQAQYERFKSRINRPLEEIEPQLRQAMVKQAEQERLEGYMTGLRAKARVAILLEPPRVNVAIDPRRRLGDADAPVQFVEFSDYECPFCLRLQATIRELREKYKGQVAFGFRDFPLQQIHPRATRAASAARCAGDQNKFWDYHTLLFTNTRKLQDEDLREYASKADLDLENFEKCLESGRHEMSIQKDMAEGASAGVEGTPAVFINGILVSGARPRADYEQVIEAELVRARQKKAGESTP